jgi:hypothetical protein
MNAMAPFFIAVRRARPCDPRDAGLSGRGSPLTKGPSTMATLDPSGPNSGRAGDFFL